MDEQVCQEVAHRVHLLSHSAWLRILDELRQVIAERDFALRELKNYFAQVALDLGSQLGADYTTLAKAI